CTTLRLRSWFAYW
nr:immunoglobulin heavy chain junction region [Mus musculus]